MKDRGKASKSAAVRLPEANLVPIGAGKGGVGKTFLTANLGIALAEAGYRTVVVDLDLGSSNLHSLLGMANENPGLGDFLTDRTLELEDLLVSTPFPNLQFLPGDGRTPFLANLPYARKRRMISRLRNLSADFVLLDLSAGSSFNTLDFFRLSSHGVLVTIPEFPAIMNMMSFLKQYLLRTLDRHFVGNPEVQDCLRTTHRLGMASGTFEIGELQSEIERIDPRAAEDIEVIREEIRPRIVFNRGSCPTELGVTSRIDHGLRSVLGIESDYFGFILEDPGVHESICRRAPFLPGREASVTGRCIKGIAHRLVRFLDRPVERSADLLHRRTLEILEESGVATPR